MTAVVAAAASIIISPSSARVTNIYIHYLQLNSISISLASLLYRSKKHEEEEGKTLSASSLSLSLSVWSRLISTSGWTLSITNTPATRMNDVKKGAEDENVLPLVVFFAAEEWERMFYGHDSIERWRREITRKRNGKVDQGNNIIRNHAWVSIRFLRILLWVSFVRIEVCHNK